MKTPIVLVVLCFSLTVVYAFPTVTWRPASDVVTALADSFSISYAECSAGEKMVGGGCRLQVAANASFDGLVLFAAFVQWSTPAQYVCQYLCTKTAGSCTATVVSSASCVNDPTFPAFSTKTSIKYDISANVNGAGQFATSENCANPAANFPGGGCRLSVTAQSPGGFALSSVSLSNGVVPPYTHSCNWMCTKDAGGTCTTSVTAETICYGPPATTTFNTAAATTSDSFGVAAVAGFTSTPAYPIATCDAGDYLVGGACYANGKAALVTAGPSADGKSWNCVWGCTPSAVAAANECSWAGKAVAFCVPGPATLPGTTTTPAVTTKPGTTTAPGTTAPGTTTTPAVTTTNPASSSSTLSLLGGAATLVVIMVIFA